MASVPEGPSSVYIHLPFCKKKCFYCDFPVVALGSAPSSETQSAMQAYVDALCSEINNTRTRIKDNTSSGLRTIYFGGGTPSLIPPLMMQRILSTLDRKIGISSDAEVTLEADPGTFDENRLDEYLNLGINRISMGVQSFEQKLLESCGRSHNVDEVRESISIIQKIRTSRRLRSWSLDLISALPGLTLDLWKETLREAIKAGPDHISVYDLQLEEGTPFARWHDQGKINTPPDEDAAAMYAEAVSTLTGAGYEHYEVSNYGKPGHRSCHNQVYWTARDPYFAFGLGAASYVEGERFSRPSKIGKYYEWVKGQSDEATVGSFEPGGETEEDALLNTVMLRLRTADGLDMGSFSSRFGGEAAATVLSSLEKHLKSGLVIQCQRLPGSLPLTCQHEACNHRLRLSDPNGFLLSNDIISDVFAAFEF